MTAFAFVKTLVAAVLVIWASAAWPQTVLEVIPLKHRTAEELIPVLQPMLPREASITGVRGQLVVRTTPANLAELRRILASIDVAPRRLMITVAQFAAADGHARGAEIAGSVRADDHVRFSAGGVRREGVRARIYDTRSLDNATVTQTVQALEGRTAYVQVGRSVPVRDRQVTRSIVGGRVVEHVVDGVDYRNANTGFLVTPRLSGERVTLELAPQREVFVEPRPGAIDVQRVTTTVSGRLGEWIEIAALSEERGSARGELLGRAGDMRNDSRAVLLKVDEIR
jgi:hypothetical protein